MSEKKISLRQVGVDDRVQPTQVPNWEKAGAFTINRNPKVPPTPLPPWDIDAVTPSPSAPSSPPASPAGDGNGGTSG